MNPTDKQIERLFQAVMAHRDDVVMAPAFGLETRVLAAWRATRSVPVWDTAVLVRGLAVAGVIMALSIWPAFNQKTSANSDTENLQLADSSVQTDLSP
jgi:hypothetical protein